MRKVKEAFNYQDSAQKSNLIRSSVPRLHAKKYKFLVPIISFIIVIILFLGITLIILSDSDKTAQNQSESNLNRLVVEMPELEIIFFNFNGNISGNTSINFRRYIDDMNGNNDGYLNISEINDYINSLKDMIGGTAYGFEIDGEYGKYFRYNISGEGIQGYVNNGNSFYLTISAVIVWEDIDNDKESYDIRIFVSEVLYGEFKFVCPPEFEIRSFDGFDNETYNGNNTVVTGLFNAGGNSIAIDIKRVGWIKNIVIWESEPNNNFTTSNQISDRYTVFGELNSHDDIKDYFIISLDSGDNLLILLSDFNSSMRPDFDLYLYDSNELQISYSSNTDCNEWISYRAESSDVYYINIHAYSGWGNYNLSVDVD